MAQTDQRGHGVKAPNTKNNLMFWTNLGGPSRYEHLLLWDDNGATKLLIKKEDIRSNVRLTVPRKTKIVGMMELSSFINKFKVVILDS